MSGRHEIVILSDSDEDSVYWRTYDPSRTINGSTSSSHHVSSNETQTTHYNGPIIIDESDSGSDILVLSTRTQQGARTSSVARMDVFLCSDSESNDEFDELPNEDLAKEDIVQSGNSPPFELTRENGPNNDNTEDNHERPSEMESEVMKAGIISTKDEIFYERVMINKYTPPIPISPSSDMLSDNNLELDPNNIEQVENHRPNDDHHEDQNLSAPESTMPKAADREHKSIKLEQFISHSWHEHKATTAATFYDDETTNFPLLHGKLSSSNPQTLNRDDKEMRQLHTANSAEMRIPELDELPHQGNRRRSSSSLSSGFVTAPEDFDSEERQARKRTEPASKRRKVSVQPEVVKREYKIKTESKATPKTRIAVISKVYKEEEISDCDDIQDTILSLWKFDESDDD